MANKYLFPAGIVILIIVFIISFSTNLRIYSATGEYNLGTGGGINKFMNGLIMNVFEILAIFIGIYLFSRTFKDKRPKDLTPIE